MAGFAPIHVASYVLQQLREASQTYFAAANISSSQILSNKHAPTNQFFAPFSPTVNDFQLHFFMGRF